MSATVRCFSHKGMTTAYVSPGSGRYTTDSVGLLANPYLERTTITATTGAAQSTAAALTPAATKLLYVQIQAGKTVAIEVCPPNRSTEADVDSPYYTGNVIFECGPGWTISIKEVTVT